MKEVAAALFIASVMALTSCSTDAYEAGDGKYSYLTASFVMAHTSASQAVDYVECDSGERLILTPTYHWAQAAKADTVYRALFYYNDTPSSSSSHTVEPVAASPVLVLRPVPASVVDAVVTDPLTVESMWLSENGRYVNMALLVKTGKPDNLDAQQTVALIADETTTDASGYRCAQMRLYHSQGGVPEYYTSRVYISIDTDDIHADAIAIEVNTYNGKVTRTISF